MRGSSKKEPTAPGEPDASTLVPRIRSLQFTAALKELKIPDDQIPYTEPLVADLLVTYAFDLPSTFHMASKRSMAKLGISPDDARALAITNLKRKMPQVRFVERGPVRQIVTGENMEACILLTAPFWDEIASKTEGEVVVSVPSRDVVLFCSSKSAKGIASLRAFAAETLQAETTHALTERLLVWRGGRWQEYRAGG